MSTSCIRNLTVSNSAAQSVWVPLIAVLCLGFDYGSRSSEKEKNSYSNWELISMVPKMIGLNFRKVIKRLEVKKRP